jgi:hypothetical protein
MKVGDRYTALGRACAAAALLALLAAAGCGMRSSQDSRPPRTGNVTLHFVSQSCFQGEIIPCG